MFTSALLSISIHDLVVASGIPTRELAATIGKPYPTLMREANPNDHGAKMDVDTLLNIMLVTGNYSPLEEIGKILGVRFVRAV